MKKLQLKEIKQIYDKKEIEFNLEPTNEEYKSFRLVVLRLGKKFGVLGTFRGKEREFIKLNTAVDMIKGEFPSVTSIPINTFRKLERRK